MFRFPLADSAQGVDLDCGAFYLFLFDAFAQGLVTEQDLRLAAQRVFTQRCARFSCGECRTDPTGQFLSLDPETDDSGGRFLVFLHTHALSVFSLFRWLLPSDTLISFRLGMFDDPSACGYNAIPHSAINSPEHKVYLYVCVCVGACVSV
jgi:hypothetical protein